MAEITKELRGSNVQDLMTVLTELNTRNISEFLSKDKLNLFVEEIKFPMTIEWRSRSSYRKNRAFYSPTNYAPIIDWLLDRNVLTYVKVPRGKRYTYNFKVHQSALAELDDLSPFYTRHFSQLSKKHKNQ